jgi:hypothetical protein
LDAVSEENLTKDLVINNIDNPSQTLFLSLMELLSAEPDIRGQNISQKRRMPQSQPINSQSSTQPSQSSDRIVSAGSIADHNQDSTGGVRVFASMEKTIDSFANQFLSYTVSNVWPNCLTLDWVQGRDPKPSLRWKQKYSQQKSLLIISPQESRLTIKDESIATRPDGSLQLEVHDPQTGGRMCWPRHYYVVPLEVSNAVLFEFYS